MITVTWRLISALVLVLIGAGSAWQFQGWRYDNQFADQARLNAETLNQLAMVGAATKQAEQDKRLALEQTLAASEKTNFEKMTNAQNDQARRRDRLATADVRLSVLLDSDSTGGCSVSAATGAGGVDHAAVRARLDPAHAQRIIAITNAADQGLIALAACQAYVREISR